MAVTLVQKLVSRFLETQTGSSLFLKVGSQLFGLPECSQNRQLRAVYKQSIFQGIANNRYMPYHLDRVWPSWVNEQLSGNSPIFKSDSFPSILTNTTKRNWTTVSYPGTDQKAIVDPSGLVTPIQNGWSLDFWLSTSNTLLSPSVIDRVTQQIHPKFPLVTSTFKTKHLKVSSHTFMGPYKKNEDLVFNQVVLKNTSNEKLSFSFFYSIRPYNPEGLASVKEIVYLTSQGFVVDNRLGLVLDQEPDNIICANFDDGDICEHFNSWEMVLQSRCKHHQASAVAEYRVNLEPGKEISFSCKLPAQPKNRLINLFQKTLSKYKRQLLTNTITDIQSLKNENEKEKALLSWKDRCAPLCEMEFPDKTIETIFRQNTYHLQNFIGKNTIFSGSFTYKFFNVRDAVYMNRALIRLGAMDLAYKNIVSFPHLKSTHKNRPVKNELDQYGQIIYALYDFYSFSKNKEFLERYFPNVETLVTKINRYRVKPGNKQAAYSGFLKPSISLNPLGMKDQFLWDNFWALAGLKSARKIATILNRPDKVKWIKAIEYNLQEQLNGFFEELSKESGADNFFIPVSVNRKKDASLISTLVSIYPLSLFEPGDAIITNTLNILEKNFLINGVYFNQIGHTGYATAKNFLLGQLYLSRKDPKLFPLLNWMTSKATDTSCWPEAIHPINFCGCAGDGHYGWTSAEYLSLIRNMVVQEVKNTLNLLPFIPQDWYEKEGAPISIKNCPTEFGKISFSLERKGKKFILKTDFQFHTTPKEIAITLPSTVTKMEREGHSYKVTTQPVVIPPTTKAINFFIK